MHSGNGARLMPSAASVLSGGSGQLTLTWFLADLLHISWEVPIIALLSEISRNEP